MKNLFSVGLVAAALAGATLVACGGDDNGTSPGTESDASPDVVVTAMNGDAKAPDAAPMGCNFATFVKGLIATDTTGTALPSADLGQECTDDQNQTEFQPLFP